MPRYPKTLPGSSTALREGGTAQGTSPTEARRVRDEEFCREHYRRVYGTMLRRVRNRQDAEDLTQQTFLNLLKTDPEIPKGYEAQYVNKTAAITRIEVHRHQTAQIRSSELTTSITPEREARMQSTEPDQENQRLAAERGDFLRALLANLSARRRQLTELHYLEHRSVDEIAERLGLDPRTVTSQLTLARQHLRRLIESDPQMAAAALSLR